MRRQAGTSSLVYVHCRASFCFLRSASTDMVAGRVLMVRVMHSARSRYVGKRKIEALSRQGRSICSVRASPGRQGKQGNMRSRRSGKGRSYVMAAPAPRSRRYHVARSMFWPWPSFTSRLPPLHQPCSAAFPLYIRCCGSPVRSIASTSNIRQLPGKRCLSRSTCALMEREVAEP